jgi:hypothetical protein
MAKIIFSLTMTLLVMCVAACACIFARLMTHAPDANAVVAGTGAFPTWPGTQGGGSVATAVAFGNLFGLAVDGGGTLYVTDTTFGVVRAIAPSGASACDPASAAGATGSGTTSVTASVTASAMASATPTPSFSPTRSATSSPTPSLWSPNPLFLVQVSRSATGFPASPRYTNPTNPGDSLPANFDIADAIAFAAPWPPPPNVPAAMVDLAANLLLNTSAFRVDGFASGPIINVANDGNVVTFVSSNSLGPGWPNATNHSYTFAVRGISPPALIGVVPRAGTTAGRCSNMTVSLLLYGNRTLLWNATAGLVTSTATVWFNVTIPTGAITPTPIAMPPSCAPGTRPSCPSTPAAPSTSVSMPASPPASPTAPASPSVSTAP